MLIVQPLIGTPELEARRIAAAQRLIDCTRTPNDAILHMTFEVLNKHLSAAEREISEMEARYRANHSDLKRTLPAKV